MTYLIRPYEPGDHDEIIGLFLANTPAYFHPREQEDLETYLAKELEHYFVATVDGEIVGCGGCNIEEHTGWLSWYIVHPGWQGKGVGSTLVRHNLAILRKDARVKKLVVRTSQLVYPFYEKFGYQLGCISNLRCYAACLKLYFANAIILSHLPFIFVTRKLSMFCAPFGDHL